VLSDDVAAITLTLYTEIGAVATIALDPMRAAGLGLMPCALTARRAYSFNSRAVSSKR
jgi:hypothetical protein